MGNSLTKLSYITEDIFYLNALGVSVKGIQPEGKCPVCRNTFKRQNNIFICSQHKTVPTRFTVYWFYRGERFTRGTTLEGKPLVTIAQAYALLNQIHREIESYKFDPARWQSKTRIEFQFNVLINKWYSEKEALMKSGKLAPSYVPCLRGYIKHYLKHFDRADVREILSCKDFLKSLPDNISLKHQKNLISTLKSFFIWLQNEERVIHNLPAFPKIEVPEYESTTVDRNTQELILQHIPERHMPVFQFMVYQGCRPSEARALKADSINIQEQWVCYRRTFSNETLKETTKTKTIRYNYLFPETIEIIKKMMPVFPNDFIFKHYQTNTHYKRNTLDRIFRIALKKFNNAKGNNLQITLYEFTKHSFGTQFINAHPEMELLLQKHFGHTKPEMTQKYAKLKVVNAFKGLHNKVEQLKKDKACQYNNIQ